ncbi:hypothetical protein PVAP13_7KG275300 [Panicum virgatum]|uniref:Nucleotide exchange factor Fes1 domain-containing protein n=1 Tax=Panicum virgatum TaxID=38727 RepID=A0A8T0QI08_PANVG|nr:hypothetical protein PVAP13_7KG275300 [Panicum virgatum]
MLRSLRSTDMYRGATPFTELMEKLKIPSDADLMKSVVDDLKNSSISMEDRQHALQELLILVEPIDSANGHPIVMVGEMPYIFSNH